MGGAPHRTGAAALGHRGNMGAHKPRAYALQIACQTPAEGRWEPPRGAQRPSCGWASFTRDQVPTCVRTQRWFVSK